MQYRVICELSCRVCSRNWVVDDHEIEAGNEEAAITNFKQRYHLCSRCFGYGRTIPVSFDDRIYPEAVSE